MMSFKVIFVTDNEIMTEQICNDKHCKDMFMLENPIKTHGESFKTLLTLNTLSLLLQSYLNYAYDNHIIISKSR